MQCTRLFHALRCELTDISVALVRDDALRVVVQLLLTVLHVLLEVLSQFLAEAEVRKHLFVALEHLDSIPAQTGGAHLRGNGFFDVRQRMLHAAGEHVRVLALLLRVCQLYCLSGRLLNALAFEGADCHGRAAERLAQFLHVDRIPAAAHRVNHVHRQHNGDAQLEQLRREIEVALNVRAV